MQPQRRSREKIPRAIKELATKHQLEEPLAAYGPRQRTLFSLVVGPCCMLFGSLLLVLLLTYSTFLNVAVLETALILFVGAAWLIAGAWMMLKVFVALLRPSPHAYIFVQGIVHAWHTVEVIRWDAIESLHKDVHRGDKNAISCSYILRCASGRTFVFDNIFHDIQRLGRMLEREITHFSFANMLDQYSKGIPLAFGEVTISPQGISVKQENATLPWNEVKYIDGHETVICIRRKGEDQDWATIPVVQVPNVCVLKAIVKHMHRKQRYTSFLQTALFPKRPSPFHTSSDGALKQTSLYRSFAACGLA